MLLVVVVNSGYDLELHGQLGYLVYYRSILLSFQCILHNIDVLH